MPPKPSKDTVVRVVSVILRVPSLFIAEAWYRTDPRTVHTSYMAKNASTDRAEIFVLAAYYSTLLLALTLALLPLRKLVNFYMYIISACLLVIAHFASFQYVETERSMEYQGPIFDEAECVQRLAMHLTGQCVLSAIIAYLIDIKQWTKFMLLVYTLPMFARVINYPVPELHRVHNFASIFMLLLVIFFVFNRIPIVMDFAKRSIGRVIISVQIYGWLPFLVAVWFKIMLPVQFLTFWMALFFVQLYKYLSMDGGHPILAEGWIVVLLASIGECCVSPFSLLGLCVTVSYVAWLILSATKMYLQGRGAFMQDNIMQSGWTEGFTMFLLAMQTGMIDLKATQRAFLMSIVLFIVFSSLIQSMYEIADPILLALGASHSPSYFKHIRAVILCTCLWMFPLYMTYMICQFFELDFWLLAIISSCVLTSVQVLGSMVVYALFLYDTLSEEPWERLDDVVYYAKATTRVLEFIVAVFVVLYGVKESLVGQWSWINTSILVIHFYFNVWQRLQAGWKSYLLRREAVAKVESLPEASDDDLANLNDVCAICFQEMKMARITPCHHFFHALCLRKWLYVQETCPMCHQKITLHHENDGPNPGGAAEPPPQPEPAGGDYIDVGHFNIQPNTDNNVDNNQNNFQSDCSSETKQPENCDKKEPQRSESSGDSAENTASSNLNSNANSNGNSNCENTDNCTCGPSDSNPPPTTCTIPKACSADARGEVINSSDSTFLVKSRSSSSSDADFVDVTLLTTTTPNKPSQSDVTHPSDVSSDVTSHVCNQNPAIDPADGAVSPSDAETASRAETVPASLSDSIKNHPTDLSGVAEVTERQQNENCENKTANQMPHRPRNANLDPYPRDFMQMMFVTGVFLLFSVTLYCCTMD